MIQKSKNSRKFLCFALILIFSFFCDSGICAQNFQLNRGKKTVTSSTSAAASNSAAESSDSSASSASEKQDDTKKESDSTKSETETNVKQSESKKSDQKTAEETSGAESEKTDAENGASADSDSIPETSSSKVFSDPLSVLKKINPNFFVTFGPMLMINTDSSSESAPSPVMYAGGAGWDFNFGIPVDAQFRTSFFMNYYLWDGEDAEPAEVENRTATGLSFLFDLCGGYTLKTVAGNFGFGAGIGFLFRYGILSDGVSGDDKNNLTGTKASADVNSINSDLHKFKNMFYPELTFTYSRLIFKGLKAGVETRVYIPFGSISDGDGFDDMLITTSLKINLPDK